jgi:transglutaminase-like putative cysteine protease
MPLAISPGKNFLEGLMLLRLFVLFWLWVRRKVGLYGMTSLALLYGGIFTVILNLSNIVRGLDDETGWISQITFAAICFGWWAGNPKRNAWLMWFACFLFGLVVVFTHAGNLWPSMYAIFRSLIFLIWTLFDQTMPEVPALISLALSWNEWVSALSVVFLPVGTWFRGVLAGDVTYDQIVTVILWSGVLGYVAHWAGWSLRRFGRPLIALLPAGVLLAGSFSYIRQDEYIGLAGFVGIVLVLIGVSRQYIQERKWQQDRVDYAEDLRVDALVSTGAISVLLVVVAAIVPIFNLRQMIDFFTTPPAGAASSESADVGESLGLQQPEPPVSPYQQVADGGLPRVHLLGTGAELSEQVMMIVEVDDPAANLSPRYYWRSLTYDTYTGRGWTTSETTSIQYREGVSAFASDGPDPRVIRQHVRLTEDLDDFVYAAGDILTLDWPYSVAWRTPAEGQEALTDQFAGRVDHDNYQVDSILPLVSASRLRTINVPLPDWIRQRYLALPAGIPSRVFDIAAEVTIAQQTPFDRAIAIERFLRSFPYSLDLPLPPLDQDIVDYFLFDLRRGYCDYYATAMVVMARASGLPARLAVGFASGEYDVANDRYVVTAAQAHSWVEIYFSGVGWVAFEPTGGQPEIVRTENQAELTIPSTTPPAPFEPVWVRWARQAGWGVAGILGVALLGFVGWNLWDVWRFRHLSPDETIVRLFFRLYPAGERLAVQAQQGATPYEFADAFTRHMIDLSLHQRFLAPAKDEIRLLTEEIRSLTEYFVRAVYAPNPLSEPDRLSALKLWRGLGLRLWWASVRLRLNLIFTRRK